MEKLTVSFIPWIARDTGIPDISDRLDQAERHTLKHTPWESFLYKPQVSFSVAHAPDALLVKYYVVENFIRIVHHADNSPVYEDSCVEFFISVGGDTYYNFEFNSIGTCLVGYGSSRHGRQLFGDELTRKIRRAAVIKSVTENSNTVSWELTLVIPLDVFVYDPVPSLHNRQCRANFYKCGDKLPEPHFLSWNNIAAVAPDFHLPKYFGLLQFI